MFSADQYQLLDFGEGRKVENFGGVVVDRPSPAAEGCHRQHPDVWSFPQGGYVRQGGDTGTWKPAAFADYSWRIAHPHFSLELRPSPFGHLGVFPEQAANWDWLHRLVSARTRGLTLLNLFAYTGGSTLAAAAAGAAVTHVDAAKNIVARARHNAELSGLQDRPIRWIAEDALKFVRREVKRGRRYDGVILDPPTYGHGPKGEVWQIDRDLPRLLQACCDVTGGRCQLVLATTHSPGLDHGTLQEILANHQLIDRRAECESNPLTLSCTDGRTLASGVCVRSANSRDN